jgi:hypothetical protein
VIDVLDRHLQASTIGSVHMLAKVVPTVSRSQLYVLFRGQTVIDVAELFAICEALGVTPQQVIGEAEAEVAAETHQVAAYEEPHPIEDEQAVPEEP